MKMEFQNLIRVASLGWLVATSAWADREPASATETESPKPSASVSRKGVDQTLALIREASLALLKEGNQRFVANQSRHPNQDLTRRATAVAEGQKPFATILACSDSRSPVEVLFDRGVGDLFVVRVAGNVADESPLATIEYGVEHLNTPLLVVLGHSGCGAVTAACQGAEPHGHLGSLLQHIKPAVIKARNVAEGGAELVPAAIQANVWQQIEDILAQSSIVREKVKDGSLQLVGAIYDLEKGSVKWLGGHPTQEAQISQAESQEKELLAKKSKPDHHPILEDEPTQDPTQEQAAEHSQRASHAAPPASFPSTLLPSKEVKARQKKNHDQP